MHDYYLGVDVAPVNWGWACLNAKGILVGFAHAKGMRRGGNMKHQYAPGNAGLHTSLEAFFDFMISRTAHFPFTIHVGCEKPIVRNSSRTWEYGEQGGITREWCTWKTEELQRLQHPTSQVLFAGYIPPGRWKIACFGQGKGNIKKTEYPLLIHNMMEHRYGAYDDIIRLAPDDIQAAIGLAEYMRLDTHG